MKYLFILSLFAILSGCSSRNNSAGINSELIRMENSPLTYILPSPKTDGSTSVEKALFNRRSHRRFLNRELQAEQLSQLLWAAYGITNSRGLRTTPSAGALYPLEFYAVIGNVNGIEAGVYKYDSREHKITRTINRDVRSELSVAALGQTMIRDAPLTIVYTLSSNGISKLILLPLPVSRFKGASIFRP